MQKTLFTNKAIVIGDRFVVVCLRFPESKKRNIIGYVAIIKSMTKLLEKAFKEAQKLSNNLQDEIARQLLEDIQNELNWQKTLFHPDIDLGIFQQMAQAALKEDNLGDTEEKGFGQV